ncbi:MAG: YraN family protein [Cytophagales bacterium]
MEKPNKTEIGKRGEQLAKDFLIHNGYVVLEQNYRFKKGEVDLIVMKDNWIVFVEVKLRKNNHFGNPEEFVSNNKIRLVHDCATHYLNEHNLKMNLRFDIVSITENVIEHFEDAF